MIKTTTTKKNRVGESSTEGYKKDIMNGVTVLLGTVWGLLTYYLEFSFPSSVL